MTLADIELLQVQIEEVLGEGVDKDFPNIIMERLAQIQSLMVNGAKCIAEAKRLHLTRRSEWLRMYVEKITGMKPSVAKEYVDTACIDEQILFTRCERNYSAMVHSADMLISLLSYHKTEMQLNK